MDEAQQMRARRESLGLNGFQILFAAVGLLQTMMKQGYEGVGVGEGKMKIISLFVSISLFAFAAAVVLPLRYTDILCRIFFFFLILACSSLLSPFVPHVLFWFPYLACVLPLLNLLELTPAPLQASLQQLCCSSWTAIRDFSCGAHQRLIRTTTRSKTTPKDDSELSTITASSPPSCGGLEEGCVLKGNNNTNNITSRSDL
ncbi:hypothetical protein AAC387_Pa10g2033 [Persea americana]